MSKIKKRTPQNVDIETMILAWKGRCFSDLLSTMENLIQEKDSEITSLKKQIEDVKTDLQSVYQSVSISGSFEDQFLLFTTNKRYLYEFIYKKLDEDEKSNLFGSLLNRFPFMPQVSSSELQRRKRCGQLEPHQEEVYDALNKFQSFISSGKRK